jgi:hypothetical protein
MSLLPHRQLIREAAKRMTARVTAAMVTRVIMMTGGTEMIPMVLTKTIPAIAPVYPIRRIRIRAVAAIWTITAKARIIITEGSLLTVADVAARKTRGREYREGE